MNKELLHITNEDCMELLKRSDDDCHNHVITSPPYNFNLRIHSGRYTKRSVNEKTKYNGSSPDCMSMDLYFNWQKEIIEQLLRTTSGYIFYNIQIITGNKVAIMKLIGHFAENIKEVLIWDKMHSEPAIMVGCLNSEYELIIVFSKNNPISRQFEIFNAVRGGISNVIRIKKNSENELAAIHSAAFPINLPRLLIKNFTKDSDLIFDPFVGTGTTAIAAHKENRRFVGTEINKEYYEAALKRIELNTRQTSIF